MGIRSRQEKLFNLAAHVVLIFISVLAVIPFWLLVASSFMDENAVTNIGYKFWPAEISLAAYKYILNEFSVIGRAYGITIIVTFTGTVLAILIVAMFAYGLNQKDVPGVKILFLLVLITMLFSGGIVPTYYVYTNVLHVRNTIWGLILPNFLMNSFNVILVKNYFKSNIPGELIEAAQVDGANHFRIVFRLVIPLGKPILATIGLLTGVLYWNDWNNGLYYITDERLYSIQQLLNKMNENIQFLANNAGAAGMVSSGDIPSATVRMAIAVVAIVPIVIAFPFFQKYFAKGITMGAVKG